MIEKSLNLARFVILIGLVTFALSDEIYKLELGDEVPEIWLEESKTYLFFELNINDEYQEGQDIIIKAIPLDTVSDPDIYVSKVPQFQQSPIQKNMYPKDSSTSEWICTQYGKDTCSLYHRNVTRGEPFYIGLYCLIAPCYFQMLIYATEEMALEEGTRHQFYAEREEPKMFQFYIPTQTEQEDAESQDWLLNMRALAEKSLVIKASAYRSDAHDFGLYARLSCPNQTEDIPSTNYGSRKGVPAWKQGQVIRIDKSDFDGGNWDNCKVDILLDAKDSGEYFIEAKTSDAVPQLYNEYLISDIVRIDNIQCYQYFIKSNVSDLQVYLTTYSGKVDFGMHPASHPVQSFQEFDVVMQYQHQGIYDLRKHFRERMLEQSEGLFYLCVKGAMTATYQLKVREFEEERGNYTAVDGYSEYFFIRSERINSHIYLVPPLESSDEDISIVATASVRRGQNSVSIFGRLCPQNLHQSECRNQAEQDFNSGNILNFKNSSATGISTTLDIDHDEAACQSSCYYIFLVYCNNDGGEHGHAVYDFVVQHSQNNHMVLKEGEPFMSEVDEFEWKYFKFVWADGEEGIEAIKLAILPVHGDSDIYVSRAMMFPNKTHFEKRSIKVGIDTEDHVNFTVADGAFSGTYYIGVYGYTYSTFGVLATVIRTQLTDSELILASSVQLYESLPITVALHNELDFFFAYFAPSLPADTTRAIYMYVTNINSHTHTLIALNRIPTLVNFDFRIDEGFLEILPTDPNFDPSGIYYVLVYPSFGFFSLFEDNWYTVQLSWKVASSTTYLPSDSPQPLLLAQDQYVYFRHYLLSDNNVLISVLGNGQTEIFVKVGGAKPTEEDFDFSSKRRRGANFEQANSLMLLKSELEKVDEACGLMDDVFAEGQNCVLVVGILCKQDKGCDSKVTLEYDDSRPKEALFGTQIHFALQDNTFTYYYVTVEVATLTADLYAILTPLSGNGTIYANIQGQNTDPDSWFLPTRLYSHYRSKSLFSSRVLRVPDGDLFTLNASHVTIVFGVEGESSNHSNASSEAYFTFVVFKNVQEVQDNIPAYGHVKEGQFAYFLYTSNCAKWGNCTIVMALSSYSSEIPDMYVIKGDQSGELQLPSLSHYDFRSVSMASDTLQIPAGAGRSNSNQFFIGVYGTAANASFFQLSVSASSEAGKVSLADGVPVGIHAKPNTVSYFSFYNWKDKDVRVSVAVSQGLVALHLNPGTKLPVSAQESRWTAHEITPLTDETAAQVLVLREQEGYCADCQYQIAVQTFNAASAFEIVAESIDAKLNATKLVRLGTSKMIRMEGVGQMRQFQFLVETKDRVVIEPTVTNGQVQLAVGLDQSFLSSFLFSENEPIYIDGEDLRIEQNYYLFLECMSDACELSLSISQPQSSMTLVDGVPSWLRYHDSQHINKHLMFPISNSQNEQSLVLTVKSKTRHFLPQLFVRPVRREQDWDYPSGKQEAGVVVAGVNETDWDKDFAVLKLTLDLAQLPSDLQGLAINLRYHIEDGFQNNETFLAGTALVTISQSKNIKLVPDELYMGELLHKSSFNLFLIEPQRASPYVIFDYSDCLGSSLFYQLDSQDLNKRAPISFTKREGMWRAVIESKGKKVVILAEPYQIGFGASRKEFMVRMQYASHVEEESLLYSALDGGVIQYEFRPAGGKRGKMEVDFSWGSLFEIGSSSQKRLQHVEYQMISSKNPHARLDQACAVKRSSAIFRHVEVVKDETTKEVFDLTAGEELYFNIIAIVEDKDLVVPYQPITLYIPAQDKKGLGPIALLILLLVVAVLVCACYFYFKSRKLERKLKEEVREIVSANSSRANEDVEVNKYNKLQGATKKGYGAQLDED